MYSIRAFIKFLLTSTNAHGVHSPFIYKYVTECLYGKTKYNYSKPINVLLKSITYFGAERVWLPENAKNIKSIVEQEFHSLAFRYEPSDILFLPASNLDMAAAILSGEKQVHNKSLLLLTGIHQNKRYEAIWQSIKRHEQVRVTIDMFHCCAVFFHTGQAKEHFKIRV